jgi:hypothetical protein
MNGNKAKGKTAVRENIPTAKKPITNVFTAGSSPKQKNYQTNPFWNPHPAYSHKDLQQKCINPAAKTNPFGPPVRSMPVLRSLGEGGFNVSLPSLCLCASVAKSFRYQANQTQSNLIRPRKKICFVSQELSPAKLPKPKVALPLPLA